MVFQVRWAKCLAPFQTLNQCDQILLLQVIMTLLLEGSHAHEQNLKNIEDFIPKLGYHVDTYNKLPQKN